MVSNSHEEEDPSKQGEAVVSFEKEIQKQSEKFIDMEHKHAEKAVIMSKLMIGLVNNIDSRQRNMLEMENKYNESLNMIIKLMGEGDTLHDECHKGFSELQELKVMNSNIKKQYEQISRELKENKTLIDLQQNKFTEVIQKHVMEITSLHIAAVKQQNDYENVLKLVDDLKEENVKLNAKISEFESEIRWKGLEHGKYVMNPSGWKLVLGGPKLELKG